MNMPCKKTIAAAGIMLSAAAGYSKEKPNVIIIYSDDQGTLDLGCYGTDDICTPNIDAPSAHEVLYFDFLDQWAVRKGDWKLIFNVTDSEDGNKRETIEGYYLTNLAKDPSERTNLADQYPEVVEELGKLKKDWDASIPPKTPNPW